jgi:hypothetical protein
MDVSSYSEKINQEIRAVPEEYLPALLAIIRLFRDSVTLKPADESFLQGWKETLNNDVLPIERLWDGINAR